VKNAHRIPQDWIVRYVAGDREAFHCIFNELHRDIYFVVRRLFQSPFDQEEAQQEVWLHLYRMRTQVDVNRPQEFIGWVKRVARNRCIDILKSRGGKSEIPVEEIGELQGADELVSAPQARQVDQAKVRSIIDTFVAKLDAEGQRFFQLCFVEERSHAEIAERMSITARRSKYLKKTQLARLLKLRQLKEHLE
jgi:RNA polymerase sigma factor (sigma-70 family)